MHRRLLALFLATALAACVQDNTAPVRPLTATTELSLDDALRRFYGELDRGSASVDAVAKELIEPAAGPVPPPGSAVQTQLAQRLPAVDELKRRQVVGESHRGYLEQRGTLQPLEERTVSDENADRRTIYEAIAAAQKAGVELVGRRRAQRIALNSARGMLLEGGDGVWYEKP